jgi:FkbM family methyltransferase
MTDTHQAVRSLANPGDLFERIIMELYRRLLPSGGVALDGGANVGYHTFQMADIAGRGRVWAVEAAPALYEILESRAKSRAAVRTINKALADHNGQALFTYFNAMNDEHPNSPLWNAGLSSLMPTPTQLTSLAHEQFFVELTTIDDILSDEERLDFIKLDIEGAEYFAIKGGLKSIQSFRPIIAFEDGGPFAAKRAGYGSEAFPSLWAELNYKIYDILGGSYTSATWIKRDDWRPWYSIALPIEFDRMELIAEAISAGCARFKLPPPLYQDW